MTLEEFDFRSTSKLSDRFAVGDWSVDVRALTITRGNSKVKLEPKVMELLVCLASHSGAVVTRQELEDEVWRDVVVSYGALTGAIIKLRKAFEDEAGEPKYIETIPKIGYRLIAEVEPLQRPDLEADGEMISSTSHPTMRDRQISSRRVLALVAAAAIALLIAGSLLIFGYSLREEQAPTDQIATTPAQGLPLPEEPSIAVLPFDNLSGDRRQDYFADGITENIIGALASLPRLFVIARKSTSVYKSKPATVQQIGRELGVRYVLEGSVHKSGERVRVTAQLIDALYGKHMWSGRYDREASDIFDLQDEIALNVAAELQVELTEGESARVIRRGTDNLEAWTNLWRSVEYIESFTKADNARARELLEKAVELDPDYADAWIFLAWRHYQEARWEWSESPALSLEKAKMFAQKAWELDDSLADVYVLMAMLKLHDGHYDEAVALGEEAVARDRNDADNAATFAVILLRAGRPDEAIKYMKKAMRLSPHYPVWYQQIIGNAHRMLRQYEEAIAVLNGVKKRSPDFLHAYVALASIYGELGREQEARIVSVELLDIDPDFSVNDYMKGVRFKDYSEIERYRDGLRKAGLPE